MRKPLNELILIVGPATVYVTAMLFVSATAIAGRSATGHSYNPS
jgi:hypothetical protein